MGVDWGRRNVRPQALRREPWPRARGLSRGGPRKKPGAKDRPDGWKPNARVLKWASSRNKTKPYAARVSGRKLGGYMIRELTFLPGEAPENGSRRYGSNQREVGRGHGARPAREGPNKGRKTKALRARGEWEAVGGLTSTPDPI
jgi:hypothetical protein